MTIKEKAFKLRKEGKSYKAIEQELHVARSTLSNWFSRLTWSENIRNEQAKKVGAIVSTVQTKRWNTWREMYKNEAIAEFPNLLRDPLFILGLSLYWGEGDKQPKNTMVRLVNADPHMINLFCRFLRETITVDSNKMRAGLVLYKDLKDEECKKFWNKVTNIPITNFYKSQYILGKHPTKRTSQGMCTVYGVQSGLKIKMLTWLQLLYKEYQHEY